MYKSGDAVRVTLLEIRFPRRVPHRTFYLSKPSGESLIIISIQIFKSESNVSNCRSRRNLLGGFSLGLGGKPFTVWF